VLLMWPLSLHATHAVLGLEGCAVAVLMPDAAKSMLLPYRLVHDMPYSPCKLRPWHARQQDLGEPSGCCTFSWCCP